MPLTVICGSERLSLDLPPHQAPLAVLRDELAARTHLPPAAFRLIHKGAVMKDDAAPLSAYRLHQNSTIILLGSADPRHAQSPSENALMSSIHAELAAVRSHLVLDVHSFLDALAASPSSPALSKEHTRLGELLLQSLLRLDAINADTDWEQARRLRKDAVKEVQGLLDHLDGAWANRAL